MRRWLAKCAYALIPAAGCFAGPTILRADDGATLFHYPVDGVIRLVNGMFQPAQPAEPSQPVQPVQPAQPVQQVAGTESILGGISDTSLLSESHQSQANTPSADVASGAESTVRNTTDAASLIGSSADSTGVSLQSRSPISNDPRIRGYRYAQINNHANGASWYAARPDLDTGLSKIDSSLIKDVVTIKGPYTVRNGPGFAFIDVEMNSTPRYCNGADWGGRSFFGWDTNGDQFYGRQTLWGGGSDWGFRMGYGHRGGVDYETGGGFPEAASYTARDVDSALGFDLSSDSTLEVTFSRLDLTDVDLPAQVNDIDNLESEAFSVRYKLEDQCEFDLFTLDSWYNRSRFQGTPAHKIFDAGNVTDPLNVADINFYNGFRPFTQGDVMTSGTRGAFTWGETGCAQLTLGADFTYLEQEYIEDNSAFAPPDGLADFGIPRSHNSTPGVFGDLSLPVSEPLTVKVGGRADWLHSNWETTDNGVDRFLSPGNSTFDRKEQNYQLLAAYVTGEYELTPELTAMFGAGAAERAPTPTDLYARSPFLAILQEGGAFYPVGNVDLDPERLKQVDAGIKAEYSDFRGGLHGFYSWVDDFITYRGTSTVNTNATLGGGEVYGEFDLNDWLTPFANMSYVEGRDLLIDQPLWAIPPLETRLGLRVTQPCDQPQWGAEFVARVVDNQDRFAEFRGGGGSPGRRGEFETPGFTTFDIRGYYRLTRTVTLTGGVENLTDKLYQEHLDYRLDLSRNDTGGGVFRPGRNFYFGLEAKY